MLFGNIAAASVTNFFPTVVATLKYKPVVTLLLTAPPYVLGVITTFATAWHADRTGERFYHVSIPLCLAMVTFIISAATTNIAARYVAIMLMVGPHLPLCVERMVVLTLDLFRFPVSIADLLLRWLGSAILYHVRQPNELQHLPLSMPWRTAHRSMPVTCTPSRLLRNIPEPLFTTASWQQWRYLQHLC